MENTKHTTGEWYINPKNQISIINNDDFLHGLICQLNGTQDAETKLANAKLIAAAPELLEALQSVLAYEQRCANKGEPKIGNGILSQIHKAIKKATE